MTHLSSRSPKIRTSYISLLKLLSYIFVVGSYQKKVQNVKRNRVFSEKLGFFARFLNMSLVVLFCIGCTRGGSQGQPTVSVADLRAQLQPLKRIGAYAGLDVKSGVLYMGNDLMERWLRLNQGAYQLGTIHYAHKASRQNYIDRPSEEFRFRIGEIVFSGNSDLLAYNDYQISQKMGGGKRITIQLTYTSDEGTEPIFYLWVHYEIYPDLPVVRKWLTIQNLTDSAFFLEDMKIESLPLFAERRDSIQIWRCGISGVTEGPLTTPWEGDTSEAFILIGAADVNRGVVLGNESAGLLKYYAAYSDRETVSIGLMPTTAINGPEIRVPPGQLVDSPKVWTMLVEGDLQTTIEKIAQNPLAYLPSYAKDTRLEASEIQWITLETEWEIPIKLMHPGDWIALDYDWKIEDLERIKQISRQVHEGGGKFGIRFPIAEIHTAILDRPEWRLAPVQVLQWRSTLKGQEAEEEGGEAAQQPAAHEPAPVVYCVLSDYGYYLTQAVKTLLEETAADALIFDHPILGSQDSLLKGCNALGHQHYTRAESIGVMYRWLFEFANHLHREYPALQLGITASAYGVEQPDTACIAHFDLFFDDPWVDLP